MLCAAHGTSARKVLAHCYSRCSPAAVQVERTFGLGLSGHAAKGLDRSRSSCMEKSELLTQMASSTISYSDVFEE